MCGQGYKLTGDIPQGDPTYDAARANMIEPFMMPVRTQCTELMNTTSAKREWTSINGVNGTKFTNKTDTSKYIFLPAAGHFENTNNYYAGSSSYYWSTGYDDEEDAVNMDPRPNNVYLTIYGRHCGHSIRAIRPWTW